MNKKLTKGKEPNTEFGISIQLEVYFEYIYCEKKKYYTYVCICAFLPIKKTLKSEILREENLEKRIKNNE